MSDSGPDFGRADEPRPGPVNAITDVAGIRVGQVQRIEPGWATGTTVILADGAGAVAAVDVRGGAPGTRETDALRPGNLVQRAQAICLTGGSAYGLAAADGVVRWLADRHRGFAVGAEPHEVVPIVPAAVLFDLPASAWGNHPDADFGYRACEAAESAGSEEPARAPAADTGAAGPDPGAVAQGSVGAGTGATAGDWKGGVGSASVMLPGGVTVGALVVVNALGSAVGPDGLPWALPFELAGEFGHLRPRRASVPRGESAVPPRPVNTTLAVIATDAVLDKNECHRVATVAHDGLARALHPVHTLVDGDTVFALATERRDFAESGSGWPPAARAAAVDRIATAGADTLARAVVHALLAATAVPGVPARPYAG